MARSIDSSLEKALITLANETLGEDYDIDIDKYQRADLYIYDQNVLKSILEKCKFKDVGNVYDYPELPQPESITVFNLTAKYDLFQRIAVSKKLNTILFYSVDAYSVSCTFLIDIDYIKKFSKMTGPLLKQDTNSNVFRDTDFKCDAKEYIEISDCSEDTTKPLSIIKKSVQKEHLVFEENSKLSEVMNDIITFFKKETQSLYGKLELAYKRGCIIHGDPGNGKSAMIREIIRVIPNVTKVVINPNVVNVTKMLLSLTKALNGRSAIIVIEDLDSLITERNRSEFLNILDGVDIKSGIYFIGTTNYPDRIDPAFMNRSGRFDRTFKIENPSENTRKIFFESRKISKLMEDHQVFIDENKAGTGNDIIDLFVKGSENLPMASLKELITSTSYLLASYPSLSVEEAVKKSYDSLTSSRNDHIAAHNAYERRRIQRKRFEDEDDDD